MWNYQIEENILYEDKEILVCRKTAGMPVQAAKIGTMDMESALKNYLAQKTPGKIPYLGVVHRLDQPVEGILVFAKTSEAAGNLSKQMMAGGAGKYYLAVTEGKAKSSEGTLTDYLKKNGLAKGGSLENALMFDEKGLLNECGFRLPLECVTHKINDLLGDLALLGSIPTAHYIGICAGHDLHGRLVDRIKRVL